MALRQMQSRIPHPSALHKRLPTKVPAKTFARLVPPDSKLLDILARIKLYTAHGPSAEWVDPDTKTLTGGCCDSFENKKKRVENRITQIGCLRKEVIKNVTPPTQTNNETKNLKSLE